MTSSVPVACASGWRTDWKKCCLCQKEKKDEALTYPTAKCKLPKDGYSMLATNIPLFHAMHEMPIVLDPSRLDEGEGIEEALRRNNAQYHLSCRVKFNNTKLEQARKRHSNETQLAASVPAQTKLRRVSREEKECILCGQEAPVSDLRQVMTMNLNDRLNECAKRLNDGHLLGILSGGDAIAQELKYHRACLTTLYNKERAFTKSSQNVNENEESDEFPQAFSELVTYILESSINSDGPVIFRLADMVNLFKQRLEQLGVKEPQIHSTRLKERLLSEIPELEAHKQGKDILLAFQKDVGKALSLVSQYSEAVIIAKAAKILRRHMLDHQSRFDGTFNEGCIENSIPTSLLQFVCMLEHGADIKSQIRFGASRTDKSIAQLLQYNCYARYQEGAATHRHSKNRETPFPIYMGIAVYARTRKRDLVEMLHENGMSISYDRVLEISAQMGEATLNKYASEGVVCPPALRKGLFTLADMDNIDHNPSSMTATTSFHGTSISVFQQPNIDNNGQEQDPLRLPTRSVKSVPELPDFYTNIRPAFFGTNNPSPPTSQIPKIDNCLIKPEKALEFEWLKNVSQCFDSDEPKDLTWASHHSSKRRNSEFEVTTSCLLPLLRDQSHSVATVKHVMGQVKSIVDLVNPGQTPVITADQPIYAIAKQVQWQ